MLSNRSAILPSLSLWEKSVLNNGQDSGRTGKHLEKSVAGNFQEAMPVGTVLFLSQKCLKERERVLFSHSRGQMPSFPQKSTPPRRLDVPKEGIPYLGTCACFSTGCALS